MTLLMALAPLALAEPDWSALSAQLSALRLEVSRAEGDLSALRARTAADTRATREQRAEVEALLAREELRAEAAAAATARLREAAATRSAQDEALSPVLLAHLDALQAWTLHGLPYQVDGRTEAFSSIATPLRAGQLDPRKAALRTWQAVEDEIKLAEESGMSRQVVAWPDGRALSQVAHLGLVEAYARRDGDGTVAHARRVGDAWTFVPLQGDEAAAVTELFTAFTHGVHAGLFTLPLRPVAP